MKIKDIIVLAVGLLMCVCIVGCGQQEDVCKIGVIYPLTGMAGSMGQEFYRGVQMAIDEAKDKGANVELYVEDSKTDSKVAVAAYHSLRARGVKVILTTVTGCASAIIPMAKRDGILMFADVAKPNITDAYENLFRHSSTAGQEADVIVSKMHEGASVGLLWMHDEYCLSLRETIKMRAKDLDVQLIDVAFDKENDVVSSVQSLLKALPKKCEDIVVVGFGAPLGKSIKRLRESGYDGRIYTNMGLAVTADARNMIGDKVDKLWYTNMIFDRSAQMFTDYKERFIKRFGSEPNDYSLLSHNTASLVVEAVSRQKKWTPRSTSRTIVEMQEYIAVGETMQILRTRDVLPTVAVVNDPL